jgi:hypothetical protein
VNPEVERLIEAMREQERRQKWRRFVRWLSSALPAKGDFWDFARKVVVAGFILLAISGGIKAYVERVERSDRALRASICQYNHLPLERCYPP